MSTNNEEMAAEFVNNGVNSKEEEEKSSDSNNNELNAKTANISSDIIADKATFSESCCLIYKIWTFITSLIALILFIAIYLPIIIIMVLIAIIYGIFGQCCSRNLRRQIILCGGFKQWLSFFVRNKYGLVWLSMTYLPIIKGLLNDYYTASLLKGYTKQIHRVPKYTLKHDYVTMDVLYNESKTCYSRVLPSNPNTDKLPPVKDASSCFLREKFVPEKNAKLSLLIGYYAQWFSHQFFNTKANDPVGVNQPVGINLGQLYGSTLERQNYYRSFKNGLLRSCWVNGEEYPPIINMNDNNVGASAYHHKEDEEEEEEKKSALASSPLFHGTKMFDIPIDLAAMVPGFAAIHIIFFRHHQYVSRTLHKYYPTMDDEQLYQISRLILGLTVIKITMEDYVANGLQTSNVKVHFDPNVMDSFLYKCFGPTPSKFHSTNAIQTEFNFAYRWHQFYPEKVPLDVDGNKYLEFPLSKSWNAAHLFTDSSDCIGNLENLLLASSKQSAGKLTLLNTNSWLVDHVITRGIDKGRKTKLGSYNDYRVRFGFSRIKNFDDITDDIDIVNKLKSVYNTVDDIDYYVGIWAEKKEFAGVHGPFLAHIGVGFTYTGIFASRLWMTDRVNKQSLTPCGIKLISDINNINDIVHLHANLNKNQNVSFTVN